MHTIQPTDALLVIDLQNDFCPGGALGIAGGDEIVPVVNALARVFAHVLLTQDWHPPAHISFASAHRGAKPYQSIAAPYGTQTLWPDHCVQNTRGAEFHPALDIPARRADPAQGLSRAASTPTRRFWRTTTSRPPAWPATCASAA